MRRDELWIHKYTEVLVVSPVAPRKGVGGTHIVSRAALAQAARVDQTAYERLASFTTGWFWHLRVTTRRLAPARLRFSGETPHEGMPCTFQEICKISFVSFPLPIPFFP